MYMGVEFKSTGGIEGIPDSRMLLCQTKILKPKLNIKSARAMIKNYGDVPSVPEAWDMRV